MKYAIYFILFVMQAIASFSQNRQQLKDSVTYYTNEKNLLKAIETGDRLKKLILAMDGDTSTEYIELLDNLATLYKNTGDLKTAESLYMDLVNIWKKVKGEEGVEYVSAIYVLADFYRTTGQFKKAEKGFLQSLDFLKRIGEQGVNYAHVLGSLAVLYFNTGQFKRAEEIYLEAISILREKVGEEHPSYVTDIHNLASIYQEMGQYEKAETLLLDVLKIRKRTVGEKHPDYASLLNTLAGLYISYGRFEKALPLYLQAMEIRKTLYGEKHASYGTILNNMAGMYIYMGQYEKAEPLLIQANIIYKTLLGENHPSYAICVANLAELYLRMRQFQLAEPLFLTAVKINKESVGEMHPDYASSLVQLANLYVNLEKYNEAEPLYMLASDIRTKVLGQDHPSYAEGLCYMAGLFEATGRAEKAATFYSQAMEIQRKALGENHPRYAKTLGNLANVYFSNGQFDKAEWMYRENGRIVIDNIRSYFTILSEKEKQTLLQNTVTISATENGFLYRNLHATARAKHDFAGHQLYFKSLILDESRSVTESIAGSGDTSLRQLYENWKLEKKVLSKQYALPANSRRTDLTDLETRAENMEKELNRRSAAFRNYSQALGAKPAEIIKNLGNNEAAIEFVRFTLDNGKNTDSTLYAAYLFTNRDSVPEFIPLCEERQLQKLFDSAGNNTTIMVSRFYRGAGTKNRTASSALGKDLFNLVWAPLEPYLKGIKKISYSPAGSLYRIAFHSLRVDSMRILVDKYELTQYSSIRQIVLRNQLSENKNPASVSLFGDAAFAMDSTALVSSMNVNRGSSGIYAPGKREGRNGNWAELPGTAEEIRKIKMLFDQNNISTTTFSRTTATEENLKALSGKSPAVLHIATHGFFLPAPESKSKGAVFGKENTYSLADDPLLRSGLILAGGNYAWSGKPSIDGIEDGIATAYEIAQLDLSKTELVVLSACETALGDIKGSEGVFGLQRAFKMAGVKKMIVSLWQVPDKETAELMTVFYSYWLKGKSIEEAFARAQSDMRKKYSPYYWAAFVLIE